MSLFTKGQMEKYNLKAEQNIPTLAMTPQAAATCPVRAPSIGGTDTFHAFLGSRT